MSNYLDELAGEIRTVNAMNGWNVTKRSDWEDQKYKIPAIIALIHSEASEALEAYRENDMDGFCVEMADIFIRVLDCVPPFCAEETFESIVRKKIEKNRMRGYRHGDKRV